MRNLTLSQKKILDFIKKYLDKHEVPPTYELIARNFGFSAKSTVHYYISALVAKGYLTKEHYISSGITLHSGGNVLPVLGKVAAGLPIDFKKYDERIEVPGFMVKGPGTHFVLQVSGDSMINEGILDGDFVIIREQKIANNGDIVVAELDDSATIKRFYRKKNQVELHSANEKYKPILINEDQSLRISGIYCGLLRK